ncbi:polyadenylate-binding protein 1-like [Xyrauchen texanus]|uniref:polyadenylate-binding protein 1-like n=1 Tax=Xyrauchen texanus TaxID=154827 RepID=UPI002241D8D3|nr:polyadenylate-binding protein 1-like [Xyrauchen texanus]
MASLFVGDLHPEVTEVILQWRFIPFGPIQSIRVCRDRETLCSLGYAFINFVHQADAVHAMDKLMFADLMGRPMRIMWSQRDSFLRKSGIGNIYIKGLARSIDNFALYDMFSAFGNILSCKVISDENGSKGYGFVHYSSYEAAERAILTLNGMLLNNQIVSICHFKPFEERQAGRNENQHLGVSVYISSLPYRLSDDQLHSVFSPFGTILYARVMREGGRSKGFGFVSFFTRAAATKAVEVMNGSVVGGRALRVVLSKCREQEAQPGNQDSSNELPVPVLHPCQPAVPSGHFKDITQVQNHIAFSLASQFMQLHLSPQHAEWGFLSQGDSPNPLISATLLNIVSSAPPAHMLMFPESLDNRMMVNSEGAGNTIRGLSQLQDRSDTSRVPVLPSCQPAVPFGQFMDNFPWVHVDVSPANQLMQLHPVSRQAAAGVLPHCESLHPLISESLFDIVSSALLPRMLVSLVTPDYRMTMILEGVDNPKRELLQLCQTAQTALPQSSRTLQIIPERVDDDTGTALVRAAPRLMCDSRIQSPRSMWGFWLGKTLENCVKSGHLICPTSWTILRLCTIKSMHLQIKAVAAGV